MRILSCNIENFGKLSNCTFDFTEGMNTVCEDNGWGKSTFAAFVKAMFYGLEGERKRSLEDNERKRYKPWQGGAYGGRLAFEVDGRRYEITRIFGDKESADEYELRNLDTNLISLDYSKNIGEELFGINKESFSRTAFFGQNLSEALVTDDINAKIGNLTDNTNDINNYEAANMTLTSLINSLTPKRVTGSINRRQNEISECERIASAGPELIKSMENCKNLLENEEENYRILKARCKTKTDAQITESKRQSMLSQKKEWTRLKKEYDNSKEAVDQRCRNFANGIPTNEELETLQDACENLVKLETACEISKLDDEQQGIFENLQGRFVMGVPDREILDDKIAKAKEISNLEIGMRGEGLSLEEQRRFEELDSRFGDEEEPVNSMIIMWNEVVSKKNSLGSTKAALLALKSTIKKKGGLVLPIILMAIGALLILGRFAPYYYEKAQILSVQILYGMLAGGAALVLAGLILIIHGRTSKKKELLLKEADALQMSLAEDMEYIENTVDTVSRYIERHRFKFSEATAAISLQEILTDSMEYISLSGKRRTKEQEGRAALIRKEKEELMNFAAKYCRDFDCENMVQSLYILKTDIEKYEELKERKSTGNTYEKSVLGYKDIVSKFNRKYGFNLNSGNAFKLIDDIKSAVDAYQYAQVQNREAGFKLAEFEKENDLSKLGEIDEFSDVSLMNIAEEIKDLNDRMEESRSDILSYSKQLDEIAERISDLEDNQSRLENLRSAQETEQKKYDCLVVAKDKLAAAKEAITVKYTDPIKDTFGKYYEMISGKDASKFRVDANTNITVDAFGKQREVNSLSQGNRDLVWICLRLALIDAMYQNEAPFIIMDDPFSNFDDARLEATKTFLDSISANYQVIYFTCSNIRS